MRQYNRKIIICLIPVLLALWAIWYAWDNDRFKLGVDLSGGTILVYEIDTRKQDKSADQSPGQQANLLAEALKRRIDPNDLYNIVIRPAGEGRVEIILPTGGPERAKRAEEQWQNLLREMEAKYGKYGITRLDVNRGRVQELAERIQQIAQEHTWGTRLFNNPKALQRLVEEKLLDPTKISLLVDKKAKPDARRETLFRGFLDPRGEALRKVEEEIGPRGARLGGAALGVSASGVLPGLTATVDATLREVPRILWPFYLTDLKGLIGEVKHRINDYAKEKEVDSWFKQQAWDAVIERMVEKWPHLKERKDQLFNTLPDAYEELIGRAEVSGDSIAQALVNTLRPLMGDKLIPSGTHENVTFLDREEVRKFLFDNYGPSLQSIEKTIEEAYKKIGRIRDLTVEEVQRIKELVSKVGSLEFRILANAHDDKEAIAETKAMFDNPLVRQDLDERRKSGKLPPAPTRTGMPNDILKQYDLSLARGAKSRVTYGWVELGPQERQSLGLDNAARTDPGRGHAWHYLAQRRGEAHQIPPAYRQVDDVRQYMLGGALFYSRECEDRNLPEEERRKKKVEYFVLTRNPEIDPDTAQETPRITGDYLSSAAPAPAEGRPAVSFTFNPRGGELFRTLTRKNVPSEGAGGEGAQIKRHLAIILDGLIQSAPTINSEIGQHGQITGNFTPREVDVLVNTLRAGALPATLKPQPVSESTMAATLGQDTVRMGLTAVLLAFLAVMLFMIVYYRFAGLVASVALLANLVLTIGFMVAVQATFTLPGLAGLVLMLGMAVDANVLIYERLREERERGASLILALRNGYDRAFPAIIDTHLTSIFTAIVLYVVGNDQLKGFGVALAVGLIISLFTSLFMTRLIFDIWQSKGWLRKLSMLRLFARPDIDFMRVRYFWLTLTVILTVLGLGLFIARLPNDLNIDFVGGTAYAGLLKQGKDVEELRGLLAEERQKQLLNPVVKEVNLKEHRYEIAYLDPDGKPAIRADGKEIKRTVLLANKPEFETEQERVADVTKRASDLPDHSVEQIFSSVFKETEPGKSPLFNVRTSEKEPELVQAVLDRLLMEKNAQGRWESLLRKVEMTYDRNLLKKGRETKLNFAVRVRDEQGERVEPYPASPSFVRTLLNRELLRAFADREVEGSAAQFIRDIRDLPFQIELTGEGEAREGRFTTMKLTFTPHKGNLDEKTLARIKLALDQTRDEFGDRPQPERLEIFDSQLAAETRLRALYAILLSWGAILLYLWFRFGNWTWGLAAVLCLVHDLMFCVGVIASCHLIADTAVGRAMMLESFQMDMTGMAALLTLVGYSVSDTIVVFDRIREVRGKSPELTPQMVNDSINQTLSRTLLTSFTTFLVVIVLYIWGGEGVHLFSFVMVVGIIIGTLSSIYVASPLLLVFGEGVKAERAVSRAQLQETGA